MRFGTEDGSTTTTPTKILAASASLMRGASTLSSSSTSTIATNASHYSIGSLRNDDNRRVARDAINILQDMNGEVPDEVAIKMEELIDRLVDTESETRNLRSRLDFSWREVAKANESSRSIKNRLAAVYAELDKKNEYLDRMIAKCQILTEKVAAQEEIICMQKRLIFNMEAAQPVMDLSNDLLSDSLPAALPPPPRSVVGRHRSTQSLKNLFAFRR